MTAYPAGETTPPASSAPPPPAGRRFSFPPVAMLSAILVAGLALRLANLGGKSLWLDEAYSVIQSQRPEVAFMGWADKVHPPLHFMLLHYWMELFGAAEAVVRLPSVIVSMLNILLLFWLARRLFGAPAALLAAGLLAFSPLDVWYAQEARMYLFVAAAALLMALGLARRDWRGGALIFLGLGFGLYADYLTIPLWTGLSALWFIGWWQQGRPRNPMIIWLLASIAGWLFYRPWWAELAVFLNENLEYPYLFNLITRGLVIERLSALHLGLGLVLATLCVLAGAVVLQRLLHHPRWARPAGLIILAGFILVTLSMLIPRLYSLKRVLVTGWPLVILLVVWVIFHLAPARRPVSVAFLGVSLLCSLLVLFFVPKDDWRAATAHLATHINAQELVWLDPPWNDVLLRYYQPDLLFRGGAVPRLAAIADTGDISAIWFIAERPPGRPAPGAASERWLDENWALVEAVPFYNLELRHYRPEE